MSVVAELPPDPPHLQGTRWEEKNMLVQGVVRGVMDNMEFVLSDLNDIMGNIQSLISHIDSVTSRRRRRAVDRNVMRAKRHSRELQTPKGDQTNKVESNATKSPLNSCENRRQLSSDTHQGCQQNETFSPSAVYKRASSKGAACKENVDCGSNDRPSSMVMCNGNIRKPSTDCGSLRLENTSCASETGDKKISRLFPQRHSYFEPCKKRKQYTNPDKIRNHDPQIRDSIISENTTSKHILPRRDTESLRFEKPGQTFDYFIHERSDSTASCGDYDLAMQQITFRGDGSGSSHGSDLSKLSFHDSPLRLRYSQNSKKLKPTLGGSIAVVHPIPKHIPQECFENSINYVKDVDVNNCTHERVFTPRNENIMQANMKNDDGYEVPISHFTKNAGTNHGPTVKVKYVYNRSFQPITPTEHNTVIPSRGNNVPIQNDCRTNTSTRINLPCASNSLSNMTGNDYCLPYSPIQRRHRSSSISLGDVYFDSNRNIKLNRAVYARIDGSPASTRSSLGRNTLQPRNHHYYHSIDSDFEPADSRQLNGNSDGRIVTPDLDWSYLNLMDTTDRKAPVWPKTDDDAVHVVPRNYFLRRRSFDISLLSINSSPGIVKKLPFYHILTSQTATPSEEPKRPIVNIKESIPSPMACDGINSRDISDYCGCYEAEVDSVLENIAGFESFEIACKYLENDDILYETYIDFDDQFEEDDWDVGLQAVTNDSFDFDFMYSSEFVLTRENKPEEDVCDRLTSSRLSLNRPAKRPTVLTLSNLSTSSIETRTNGHSFQREIRDTSSTTDSKVTESPTYDLKSTESSHTPPGGYVKRIGNQSILVNDHMSNFNDITCAPDMITSYDTSCQAVASGSPMSLCSSSVADSSPDSERCFITSSEGDDLFASHDESYFLLSPSTPENGLDNAPLTRRGTRGRTSTRELTQQFLLTLRDVCEQYGSNHDSFPVTNGIQQSICSDDEVLENTEEGHYTHMICPGSSGSSAIASSSSTSTNTTITLDTNVERDIEEVSESDLCGPSSGVDGLCSTNNSYGEDIYLGSQYNRNVNPWTTYTMVDLQTDDTVSDGGSSDLFLNDNDLVGLSGSVSASFRDVL